MGWPSFSVHGRSVRRVEGAYAGMVERTYAGMVERTYAGDVTSVRAGLRRRILLRLRESAKIIVPGAELAFGSNSSPWHNNADSRSPSSITPPPQQPEPMPHPRLKLQPQGTEADVCVLS